MSWREMGLEGLSQRRAFVVLTIEVDVTWNDKMLNQTWGLRSQPISSCGTLWLQLDVTKDAQPDLGAETTATDQLVWHTMVTTRG